MKPVSNDILIVDKLEDSYKLIDLLDIDEKLVKTRGKGVKIALIDTGADVEHEEIKDNIKSKFNMINKNYDVSDGVGHGTAVAGLLVGNNVGIAPQAELHVIKVLDDNGSGAMADVMDGITHAINIKADILCISLGIKNDMPLIIKQRVIQAYEAGMIVVCSVGNDSSPYPRYPSAMDVVIAVGGTDGLGNLSKFSNRGYDVLAPSENLLSSHIDGKYAYVTGTSMASPIVAGLIALMISYGRENYESNLKFADIKAILKNKPINYVDNNKK